MAISNTYAECFVPAHNDVTRFLDIVMTTFFEDEFDQKERFAFNWLKNPNNPWKVANALFGQDLQRASYVAQHWIVDALVLSFKADLLEKHGARYFLPTKEEYARDVYDMATDERIEPRDRLHAFEIFGKTMGYIEKPADTHIGDNNITLNRVMIIRDIPDSDKWEQIATKQQKRLM